MQLAEFRVHRKPSSMEIVWTIREFGAVVLKLGANVLQVTPNSGRCGASRNDTSLDNVPMPHKQSELVEIRYTKDKGRGVFARKMIPKGTVIERVPVVVVTWDRIEDSELAHYAYTWTETKAAIALGYGSLYNHSFKPNACYEDEGRQTKVFTAIRNIEPGEEITVNYNGDPKDRSNELGFDIID